MWNLRQNLESSGHQEKYKSHTSVGRKFAPVEGLNHDLVCTGSIYHVHFAWQVWHGQLSPRFKFNKLKSFSGVEIDQNHVDKRILGGKGFAVGRLKRHNFCPASVYIYIHIYMYISTLYIPFFVVLLHQQSLALQHSRIGSSQLLKPSKSLWPTDRFRWALWALVDLLAPCSWTTYLEYSHPCRSACPWENCLKVKWIHTMFKVDGAILMSWFIIAPYTTTFWSVAPSA